MIWDWARRNSDSAFQLLEKSRDSYFIHTAPPAKEVAAISPGPPSFEASVHTRVVDSVSWNWPTLPALPAMAESNNFGIDFLGNEGDPVIAASSGVVVFSGSGLNGYGNLIIIKHNQMYLTAYAHNQERLVKEGDAVDAGQLIARMGKTQSDRVKLRFELRKGGQPVDPLQYLPAK